MAFIAQKLISASGATEETDDDFNLVTGLYHFDGSNGAQNNTFLDSSSNSFSVTRAGNSTQGTFSPFSADDGKWSAGFPVGVASNKIECGTSADFAFGTGAFTIEAWVFVTADTYTYSRLFNIASYNATDTVAIVVDDTSNSHKIRFAAVAASGSLCISQNATPRNEWFHVAVSRDDTGDFRLFVNGNLDSTNTSYRTTNISPGGNQPLTIGGATDRAVEEPFEGFISNFRVIKGSALYTSTFTPSTSPLTAVTNTKLLTCCSNRFKDKSTSAHTVTVGGTPKIQPFSPFAPSASYNAAVNGGSGFFDGTDDYLEVASSSDFDYTSSLCVDGWFYMTETPGDTSNAHCIVSRWAASSGDRAFLVDIESDGLRVLVNQGGSTNVTVCNPGSSGAIDLFSWHHFALTWDGTTYRAFLDGVLEGSATGNAAPTGNGKVVRIGYNSNNHYFGGYISNVRIVADGGAIYTSAFTPPTSLSTAITNTELLLNFTNAAMFDQTGKTNIDTIGNAQLDTSVKKFGTASAEFDGNGDRLILSNKDLAPVGTQSFTIECFIYVNANKNYNGIYSAGVGIQMYVNSSGKLQCWLASSTSSFFVNGFQSTTTIPTSTWRHIALVRDSSANTLTWFVEGLEKGQQTSVTDSVMGLTTFAHTIGSYQAGTYAMNGYIDEFRITNKARYTSNFTAPSKEFPNR